MMSPVRAAAITFPAVNIRETPSSRMKMVLLAGDHLSEAGIVGMLGTRNITLVPATLAAQAQAVIAVTDTVDDLLLERIRMAAVDGRPVILVLTDAADADARALAGAGVRVCLCRAELTPDRLCDAVQSVQAVRGVPVTIREVAGRLAEDLKAFRSSSVDGRTGVAAPSGRELDVLQLIAEGFDTAEIAEKMQYSERTVKNILYVMTARLGLRNRAQAVAYALRAGLL